MKYMLISSLFLAGCVTPKYTKPGATQQEFMRDRYECLRQTQQRQESMTSGLGGSYTSTVRPSCSALGSCLAAYGYYQDDNGELIVPKGANIKCTR